MVEYLAVFTITLFAVISPGPDFAMVTRNSLLLSRRAGILTAVGIGGGILVHVSYTLIGIGFIIQQSLWLFNMIKLIGAEYLIWLGVKMLQAKPTSAQPDTGIASFSDGVALRTGFLTNALNPKATVFIVSLFMQVVSPQTSLAVQIGYGIFISIAHILWFCLVALFFSSGAIRERLLDVRHWIDKTFGGVLVGLGVLLALARR